MREISIMVSFTCFNLKMLYIFFVSLRINYFCCLGQHRWNENGHGGANCKTFLTQFIFCLNEYTNIDENIETV